MSEIISISDTEQFLPHLPSIVRLPDRVIMSDNHIKVSKHWQESLCSHCFGNWIHERFQSTNSVLSEFEYHKLSRLIQFKFHGNFYSQHLRQVTNFL